MVNYYFDMVHTVGSMLKTTKDCFICGSKEELEPHHIRKVSKHHPDYCDSENIVILCRNCHLKYHKKYGDPSPKAFINFVLERRLGDTEKYKQSLGDLEKQRKLLKKQNDKIKLENKRLIEKEIIVDGE